MGRGKPRDPNAYIQSVELGYGNNAGSMSGQRAKGNEAFGIGHNDPR